jgi:hypothetical protein
MEAVAEKVKRTESPFLFTEEFEPVVGEMKVSEMDETLREELLEFTSSVQFIYAKTMPQCPHFYIVRNRVDEEGYVKLWNAIKQYGSREKYKNYPQLYLYLGDGWKYWKMCSDIRQSIIINRARGVPNA